MSAVPLAIRAQAPLIIIIDDYLFLVPQVLVEDSIILDVQVVGTASGRLLVQEFAVFVQILEMTTCRVLKVFCAQVILPGGALLVPLLYFLAVHFVVTRRGSLNMLIMSFAFFDFGRWFLL